MVYRTVTKKVFWEFHFIIMQNLSDSLPLFCTPTWPSDHVSENQEYQLVVNKCVLIIIIIIIIIIIMTIMRFPEEAPLKRKVFREVLDPIKLEFGHVDFGGGRGTRSKTARSRVKN